MKIYIEFVGAVAEKTRRNYAWLNVEDNSTIETLFLKVFPSFLGRETAETLFKSFLNREIIVTINGVLETDIQTKLNDGDKLHFFPMASGG